MICNLQNYKNITLLSSIVFSDSSDIFMVIYQFTEMIP